MTAPAQSARLVHRDGVDHVIAYCRPFDGSAWLPPEWPGYTRAPWQDEHQALIDFRHSFVGHSDLDPRTVTIRSTAEPPGWSSRLNLPVFMPGRAERALEMCRDITARLHGDLGEAALELVRRERKRGRDDATVEVVLARE